VAHEFKLWDSQYECPKNEQNPGHKSREIFGENQEISYKIA